MNLKQFIANALGGVAIELVHAMGNAFDEKFLQIFEDPDGDGIYVLKSRKVQLREGEEPVPLSNLVARIISSMIPKELEFEFETPIHFHDDTDGDGDIEVSLKKTGLFKERSHLKVRMLMEKGDIPEGLQLLRDAVNMNLHKDLEK